jgi:threonine dehydrogenase-like Zn-dependent dehydrogenase
MKAFVKDSSEPRGGRLCVVDDPKAGPEDVIVRVEAAGLCGTDISLYAWWPWVVQQYRPVLPLILGHEVGGTVVEVGRGVHTVQVGDRVSVLPLIPCGLCFYCRHGDDNLCQNRVVIGVHVAGGLAELVSVPEANVVRMPQDSDFRLLALWEPFAAAQHALVKAPVGQGDVVAIIGAGGMGLMVALSVLARGAGQCVVIGLSRDERRLQIAEQLGAQALNGEVVDPVDVVRCHSGGRGADVVFEAAGQPSAVAQALELARPGASVCLIGTPHDPTSIYTGLIGGRELRVVGSRAHSAAGVTGAKKYLSALSAGVPLLQPDVFDLADADHALRAAEHGDGFKVIIRA